MEWNGMQSATPRSGWFNVDIKQMFDIEILDFFPIFAVAEARFSLVGIFRLLRCTDVAEISKNKRVW